MYYPFMLYDKTIDQKALFSNLQGAPYVADLSWKSPLIDTSGGRDQVQFQALLENQMAPKYSWAVSPYLERRDTLLADCPQMATQKRFYHLGLDIIVPVGTALHAPLGAVVVESGYESGEGNYGGFVLLQHTGASFETFYSLYGHLDRNRLPPVGQALAAGEDFARIGDFPDNGNWFHHTHFQIITQKGIDQGYLSKGYCTADDLATINDLCPSPISLFIR